MKAEYWWLCMVLFSSNALASACPSNGLNVLNDLAWSCIFPIRIGGVVQLGANQAEADDQTPDPICVCQGGALPRIGLSVSFWEPARVIETVSEPYCMMALGANLGNPTPGKLDGSLGRSGSQSKAFQQMHYIVFPAWALLDMFTDLPCLEEKRLDVAMMTEVVGTWNNEILSLLVNPESVLFANPASTLACAADASSALLGKPRNELFWCMGSWGGAYPLAGSITATDYVEANAGLAARGVYLMGRTGLLRDTGLDGCSFQYTPIWRKNRYKFQLLRPVADRTCHAIGQSGLLWTAFKHPPQDGDNFMWMLFRKVNCCVSYE